MKKRIVFAMASILSFSCLSISANSIYALETKTEEKEEQEKIEIETPQDFVKYICSQKLEEKDKEDETKVIVTYKIISTVNEDTYLQILDGKILFDSFDEEWQEEVNTILKETILPSEEDDEEEKKLDKTFEDLYQEALVVQEQIEAEKEQEDNKLPGDQDSQEGEETPQEEGETEDLQNGDKEDSEEVDNDLKEEEKDESLSTDTAGATGGVVQTPISQAPNAVLMSLEQPLEKQAMLETQPTEKKVETSAPVQVTSIQSKVSALDGLDSAVQAFVKSYLMDANGNLYTQITASNYRQILSGVSAYTSLSTSQVSNLNTYLINNGSKRYITLVSQAQRYENTGSTADPNVHTAAATQSGLYAAGMTISLGALAFVFKKYRKEA